MDRSLKIIAAPSLREQVVERIRAAIVSGRFRPGDRLIERELCASLDVSRTSVREALRELEAEGLITMLPNRGGPIVAVMDRGTVQAIYQVRAMLEGLAAKLFATKASDRQLKQMDATLRDLEAAYESGDTGRMLKRKAEFYRILLEGAGNEVAAMMLQNMHSRVSLLRATTLGMEERARNSLDELRRIVKALMARDAELAWQETVRHVENAASCALSLLADEEPNLSAARRPRRRA